MSYSNAAAIVKVLNSSPTDGLAASPFAMELEKETDGAGQGEFGNQSILWGRQIALAAYKARVAAKAIEKQASIAMAIANTAAAQVGYIANHPCMRMSQENSEDRSEELA